MHINCSQKSLAKGISAVGRAVAQRSSMSVLSNILFDARGSNLRLCATNLEVSVSCWIPAEVFAEGAVSVPAKLVQEFVSSLPDETVQMRLNESNQTLHMQCARIDAKVKGMPASDFPAIPLMQSEDADGIVFSIENQELRDMINQVSFAASTDFTRPALTGVEMKFVDNSFSMAATDGYRLSIRTKSVDVPPNASDKTFIVPVKGLNEVARLCTDGDKEQPVQMWIPNTDKGQVIFGIEGKPDSKNAFERVEIVCQLIDGRYPTYSAIIPKSHETSLIVDSEQFLNAVKVASLFVREQSNLVRMSIDPEKSQLRITAQNNEQGDNITELDADVQGQPVEISFNAKFLSDVLSQINYHEVVIETSSANRPATFRPSNTEASQTLHVIMPMANRNS